MENTSTFQKNLQGRYVVVDELFVLDRIFFCEEGFGCHPDFSGRKIFGHFVTKGEPCFIVRGDVLRFATDQEIADAKARVKETV